MLQFGEENRLKWLGASVPPLGGHPAIARESEFVIVPPDQVDAAPVLDGVVLQGIVTEPQFEVIERAARQSAGVSARGSDRRVEIPFGDTRINLDVAPGGDAFTIAASYHVEDVNAPEFWLAATLWDSQILIFSNARKPSTYLAVSLSRIDRGTLNIDFENPFALAK